MKLNRKASQVTAVRYPSCAGIDVAKDLHAVALPADAEGGQAVRMFGGYTENLQAMAEWLWEHGIEQVALESTGVYWIPVYEVLDARGFDVWLVNPVGLARPDRRKSDILDCQWLQQLMSLGLLRKSHRPADAVCELRSYVRNRQRLIKDRARSVQHMQKALQQMNVKLDSVLSDISGKSGMAIIEAIVSGERDAATLAGLCDRRVKRERCEIAAALLGNWREEHLFALQQALESHEHFSGQLQRMEERILALAGRLAAEVTGDDGADGGSHTHGGRKSVNKPRNKWQRNLQMRLWDMFGVDLTAIPGVGVETALTMLAELGHDFSEFGGAKQFSQWLSVSPGTNISGGKRLSGAKSRGTQVAGQALRMSAMTLRTSQSVLGDRHRKRCARMDPPRAIKASAHELARIIYAMVTKGSEYMGMDRMAMTEQTRERRVKRLHSEAKKFGLDLVQFIEPCETSPNQAVA